MVGSGGFRGGAGGACPPPGHPNSFDFMQFLGKFWQNRMLAPPRELAPPLGKSWIRRWWEHLSKRGNERLLLHTPLTIPTNFPH